MPQQSNDADGELLFEMVVRESFTPMPTACGFQSERISIFGDSGFAMILNTDDLQIRNLDTGEVRKVWDDELTMSFIPECMTPTVLDGVKKPWQDWWKEKWRQDEELWIAAESGEVGVLKAALDTAEKAVAPRHIDARSSQGHTALQLAASGGHVDNVALLLKARADLRCKTNHNFTALHLAARRGHFLVVELLLDSGADTLAQTTDGNLALHFATAGGHTETVEMLLSMGSSLQASMRNNLGQRPAEVSPNIKIADIYRKLLLNTYSRASFSTCADSNSFHSSCWEDQYAGRTPLHSASVLLPNSRADAVRKLLSLTQQRQLSTDDSDLEDGSSSECTRASPRTISKRRGYSKDVSPVERQVSFRIERQDSSQFGKTRASFAKVRDGSSGIENAEPSSFAFVKLLGKGAFGEVFQVTHKTSKVDYAMKVLRKNKIMTGNLLRYSMTERNVLSYIRHPYIVSLHYAFQTASHLVLVLEFCPNGNLQKLIESERRLQESLARIYTAEILLALCHLHERRIVYRDLKPENVVMDSEGHAKLTDFGLSKEGVAGLKGTQSFCGSLAFIAPEVLARKGHGHAVDNYGLGVLLFAMLTGMPPFYHPERHTLLVNIKTSRLRVPQHVGTSAGALIEGLMERDPVKRMGTNSTADVKSHAFFEHIDWDALMRGEVPSPIGLWRQPSPRDASSLRPEHNQRAVLQSPICSPFQPPSGGLKSGWEKLKAVAAGSSRRSVASEPCPETTPVCGWEFASAAPPATSQ